MIYITKPIEPNGTTGKNILDDIIIPASMHIYCISTINKRSESVEESESEDLRNLGGCARKRRMKRIEKETRENGIEQNTIVQSSGR